jgi:hypothetical protein
LVATRSATTACGQRPNGAQAVTFDAEGELVTVSGNAALQFGRNLAVAAWINGATIDPNRVHTVFRQGTASEDIVALQVNRARLELVLKVRKPGSSAFQVVRLVASNRPISTGFLHVGATWNGKSIALFINGAKVQETRFFTTATDIAGSSTLGLQIGGGPLQSGVSRQFLGTIDDVWVSRQAATASDMLELMALSSCPEADPRRELLITDLSVVEDPVRTTGDGAWSFKHLMESMAPTPAQAPDMVQRMLSTWLTNQTVNGQIVPARRGMSSLVLTPWLNGGTTLDLSLAPMRLLAIVNRIDLRNLSQGTAGEGRFVFGVVRPEGDRMEFTLIVEYRLPASTQADVLSWARLWHELGSLKLGTSAFNAKLETLTRRFTDRNAAPGRVNGSALSQLRTNEIVLSGQLWELREFALTASGLVPAPVQLTPDNRFNGQTILADFINQNQAAILAEQHVVPAAFQGQNFQAGASINLLQAWSAPGIASNEARHKFSLNTCNGCHGRPETDTTFLQITPRNVGEEAALSGFLTGVDVVDPVDGTTVRHFADLERRASDLEALLCASPQSAAGAALIAKGVDRVH